MCQAPRPSLGLDNSFITISNQAQEYLSTPVRSCEVYNVQGNIWSGVQVTLDQRSATKVQEFSERACHCLLLWIHYTLPTIELDFFYQRFLVDIFQRKVLTTTLRTEEALYILEKVPGSYRMEKESETLEETKASFKLPVDSFRKE